MSQFNKKSSPPIAKQSVLLATRRCPPAPSLREEVYIFLIPFPDTLTSVPGRSAAGGAGPAFGQTT